MRKLLLAITAAALAVGAFLVHDHVVKSHTLPGVSFTLVNYPGDLGLLTNEFKDEHRTVVVLETGKDCGDACDNAEALLATQASAHPDLKILKVYYEPPPFASIGYCLPMVMTVEPGYGLTFAQLAPSKSNDVEAFLDKRAKVGSQERLLLARIADLNASANAIRAPWYERLRQLSEKRSRTRGDWREIRHIDKQLDEHAELNGALGQQLSQAQAEFTAIMRDDRN